MDDAIDPRLPSSLDQNVPQYKRDFRRKLIYFRSQPALRPVPGQCHIKVRREHIFEDAYAEIMRQAPADLRKRLMIKFDGEDGLDYGGLSRYLQDMFGMMVVMIDLNFYREFFFLLSHEMFNPFYWYVYWITCLLHSGCSCKQYCLACLNIRLMTITHCKSILILVSIPSI